MSDLLDLKSHPVSVTLGTLLKDRTTNKNIIFATDAYDGISFETNITKEILFDNSVDIRPRIEKSLEEQSQRKRKKAEVFTPSWICNKMNNHCDEVWFGYERVFNYETDRDWLIMDDKIAFPDGKNWKDYVDSKRLEITCGEAPYLVSRYDAVTGEIIPIQRRIGILDRKLRVINENVMTRKTWNHWVYRAFESVYGYEYQGDNLLIARINLLETFCDYTLERWQKEPTDAMLKRVANIISWNLWQMDGIKGVVPFKESDFDVERIEESHQMTIFEYYGMLDGAPESKEKQPEMHDCKIYDWRDNKEILYRGMKEV
jgi:hypothetical protein